MNATTHIFEQPLIELPDIPLQFGQDGGKFYHYYDQLADELDEDLTKRLKSQLDSLLIFAGLFAGVNSAFLALTLPMMSADPADDTNALLLQLVKGGNATINSEADLPSAAFSPPSAIYPVNVLFAVSLTCALMSSFLAVLGQQWLVYYRKRSGGGAEHQRNEQLRRQLGAQRWQLELVLDDVLPSLLQVGLVIFCISFVLYLRTLSGSMSTVVAAVVGTALAITVGAAVCATWDRMCPYQSPLSHLLCWTVDRMKPVVVAFVWSFIFLKTYLEDVLRSSSQGPETDSQIYIDSIIQPPEDLKTRLWKLAQEITFRGLTRLSRQVETTNDLEVALLKRVILTSEHTTALIYTATTLCAIDNNRSLLQLLNDAEFFDRLHDLFSTFSFAREALPAQLRTTSDVAVKAFAASILHIALSVGTITDLLPLGYQTQMIDGSMDVMELPTEAALHFLRILDNAMLEQHVLDGDLERVSGLLGRLIRSLIPHRGRSSLWLLQDEAEFLATCSTSHQLLYTLALAVKMSMELHQWDFDENPRSVLLPRLFELAKTTYEGRKNVRKVPFLSEALRPSSKSWHDTEFTRSKSYQLCMDVLRHACELKDLDLRGVFPPAGVLLQALELDIRLASTPPSSRGKLRAHRYQWVGLILLVFEGGGVYWALPSLSESLTETLKLIREDAAAQEPGHPENRVTLDCFRRLLVGIQKWRDEDMSRALERECYQFETWINMGGCAKSPGRLNRDPELGWCPYVEGCPCLSIAKGSA